MNKCCCEEKYKAALHKVVDGTFKSAIQSVLSCINEYKIESVPTLVKTLEKVIEMCEKNPDQRS